MDAMTSRWFPEGPISVRPRSGWVFLFFTMLVTVPVGVAAFFPPRSTTAALATTALVVTVIAYIYFVAPRVVVGEDAIRVENAWREHVVPWGALVDVETRFTLTLVTAQGRIHAQAAPGPSGLTARRRSPDEEIATERVGSQGPGAVHSGHQPTSLSLALASVIRGHRRDLVEAGALDPGEPVTTSPRVTHLALTLGGLALVLLLWLVA
jgi:hypothetical protein